MIALKNRSEQRASKVNFEYNDKFIELPLPTKDNGWL
jgi:hypothetical protein